MLRCTMCGRPAGDEAVIKEAEHKAQEQGKKPVWICPRCAGKTRFEAEETGHGLRGRQSKPM